METWGELFWDAWIRLRLWFRSLYRTYWPPQFQAWQICTVTGIVSVILTLVALNYQTTSPKLLADNKSNKLAKTRVGIKKTPITKQLAVAKSPFADDTDLAAPLQDLKDEPLAAGVDEMSPEGVAAEVPDPGFEPIGGRKFRKPKPAGEEVAINDFPLADAPVEQTEEAEPQTQLSLPPEAPEMNVPEETTAQPQGADPFEAPSVADSARTPPVETTDGIPDQPVAAPEAAEPVNDLPEPVKHEPLLTPIRSKSHYSRFGKHEDSEEERHSVREIRPTRIDIVLIPGRDAAQPGTPDSAEAETDPTAPLVPAQENPADNLSLPPAEAAPLDAAPMESAPAESPFEPTPAAVPRGRRLMVQEQPVQEQVPAEPVDEGPAPPVLFAPEPTIAEKPNKKSHEYHGPVLSTDGVDHQAHAEDDVFARNRRKTPLFDQLPVENPHPAARQPANHGPVLSTDAVDHEAHAEDDVFARNRRNTTPVDQLPAETPKPVTPPVAREPADHEPVESDEPVTEPRIARRATPRVIEDDSIGGPVADENVTESRVVPMAVPDVTHQRGPERITVPDSMPPVVPEEPTEPLGRQESSFAEPSTTQSVRPETAARLVMSITGPKQAPIGTQVVWHFKIQNLGSAPATGIVVSDVLPPGLQHRLSPDLEYTIARLDPGEERETNLTVQCVAAGRITNRAVLRADGDLTTEAEVQIEVSGSGGLNPNATQQSPLTVTHHGPERWLVDSTGQFLVTVTNTSGERQRNVTISQSFPKGTNLVHATIGHKLDKVNRTVTWTIPDFVPGASYVLETELHSITSGPATSVVQVKIGDSTVAEDRWTAISFGLDGRP